MKYLINYYVLQRALEHTQIQTFWTECVQCYSWICACFRISSWVWCLTLSSVDNRGAILMSIRTACATTKLCESVYRIYDKQGEETEMYERIQLMCIRIGISRRLSQEIPKEAPWGKPKTAQSATCRPSEISECNTIGCYGTRWNSSDWVTGVCIF